MSVPEVLIWELIKNHNSALVKRNNERFSREAFNLLNQSSFVHSGFARRQAIDIRATKNGVGLSSKKKKEGADQKPATLISASVLNKSYRKGAKAVSRKALGDSGRKDLITFALARFARVKRSQKKTPTKKAAATPAAAPAGVSKRVYKHRRVEARKVARKR